MGFLNKKSQAIDFILTDFGRQQFAKGQLDFSFFTLSDFEMDYKTIVESCPLQQSNYETTEKFEQAKIAFYKEELYNSLVFESVPMQSQFLQPRPTGTQILKSGGFLFDNIHKTNNIPQAELLRNTAVGVTSFLGVPIPARKKAELLRNTAVGVTPATGTLVVKAIPQDEIIKEITYKIALYKNNPTDLVYSILEFLSSGFTNNFLTNYELKQSSTLIIEEDIIQMDELVQLNSGDFVIKIDEADDNSEVWLESGSGFHKVVNTKGEELLYIIIDATQADKESELSLNALDIQRIIENKRLDTVTLDRLQEFYQELKTQANAKQISLTDSSFKGRETIKNLIGEMLNIKKTQKQSETMSLATDSVFTSVASSTAALQETPETIREKTSMFDNPYVTGKL